jgi:hypothetical protein
MDANIPVCFSVKTSAEWAASGLAILRGQPAFEVGDADGRFLYILVGDGSPANVNPPGVSTYPPYTRLRVASAAVVQENLDRKAQELTLLLSGAVQTANGHADAALQEHSSNTNAHNIPGQTDTKVAAHNASGTAHNDIRVKLDGIPGQTDTKVAAHNTSGTAHSDIRVKLDTKAPLENPVFTGTVDMRGSVAEVAQPRDNAAGPYSNPNQPSTVRDFLEISSLTVESAGEYLREFDGDGRLAPYEYLKILDRVPGLPAEYREADYSRFGHSAYVTNGQFEDLLNMVMSTVGQKLRITDGGHFIERLVDREYGTPEVRETDFREAAASHDYFSDAIWTETDLPAASDYFENVVWV